nr:tetratricopeptide repeat protein [Dysgonomonas sp. 521]
MFEFAFPILRKYNLNSETARCINNIGNIYLMRKDYDNAIEWYNDGLNISQDGFLYHNLGYVYQSCGRYEKAIEQYNKSLCISWKERNLHRIGINLHLLGIVYGLMSDSEKQKKYHSKCLSLYRQIPQVRRIAYCLFHIICFSLDRKDYTEIMKLYEEYQKYLEYISEDSEYILNSLVLNLRIAIFKDDSQHLIVIAEDELSKNKEKLLSYPTDSHAISAYLDLTKYYYKRELLDEARYALQEVYNYCGSWLYHRESEIKEMNELINSKK